MPLSEHEKRLLAEMEQALAADDPRLISTFNGKTPSRTRVVLGFGLILLGIFVLFGGLISQTPPLGIAGFVLSLAGAVLAITNLGGLMNAVANRAQTPKAPGGKSGGNKWSTKFEQRWDRRNFDE
ncbi:MAG: DUF3040 domain-containing protein [Candidatus Nanopelagicaceae bacterium]|nr:DUF3040 domain-containing protein [Candidatus Nanopelagicaceae bacterium]